MSSEIPKQMKALRVNSGNQSVSPHGTITPQLIRRKYYSLETIDVPVPKGHEALIKIGAAGMCHTDLLVMDDFPLAKYPLTGSHEPAGEIVALGKDAEGGKVKVGDRVAGLFHRDICCE
jgi:D-arabinose 1-dehydrogenase-like Zn-dependent alcohol dehydrogenase